MEVALQNFQEGFQKAVRELRGKVFEFYLFLESRHSEWRSNYHFGPLSNFEDAMPYVIDRKSLDF